MHTIGHAEVGCWITEDGALMLKAATAYGEAVELDREDALALARILVRAADRLGTRHGHGTAPADWAGATGKREAAA